MRERVCLCQTQCLLERLLMSPPSLPIRRSVCLSQRTPSFAYVVVGYGVQQHSHPESFNSNRLAGAINNASSCQLLQTLSRDCTTNRFSPSTHLKFSSPITSCKTSKINQTRMHTTHFCPLRSLPHIHEFLSS